MVYSIQSLGAFTKKRASYRQARGSQDPSYSEAEAGGRCHLKASPGNLERQVTQNEKRRQAGAVSSVAEPLPSMCEALPQSLTATRADH